jgi:hypothetical protein
MNPLPALACFLMVFGCSASAKDTVSPECSLALAFGLDISVSVDDSEYEMQRAGVASALADPEVRDVIVSRPEAVALMAYEWSGSHQQSVVVPWSFINNETDLFIFIESLLEQPRANSEYPTAIGRAVAFGVTAFKTVPSCARLVLDISGDGVSNDGFSPELVYQHFPVAGLTVNGLVVVGADSGTTAYYLNSVIRGPGAFVEIAYGFQDYSRAMKRKLLRELQFQQLVQR